MTENNPPKIEKLKIHADISETGGFTSDQIAILKIADKINEIIDVINDEEGK